MKMSIEGELKPLTSDNLEDVICCPGGLEVEKNDFCCDISPTQEWRKEMLELGMKGLILYQDGVPTGFVEYIPIENAPYPIKGKNVAVVMCFHWASGQEQGEDEHYATEKEILKAVIDEVRSDFAGLTALAWDHPVHFPIEMFEDVGFSELDSDKHISLMWMPFSENAERPSMVGSNFEPRDLSNIGKLAVECGYSNRCPYSINDYKKVKEIVSEIDDDRIVFHSYRMDMKEESIEFSKSPWDWNWLFLNGKEIAHMKKNKDELKELMMEELKDL